MEEKEGIENILNRDSVGRSIEALTESVRDHFKDVGSVVILWEVKDQIHHRAYGTLNEILGLMEKAKFIMLSDSFGIKRGGKE